MTTTNPTDASAYINDNLDAIEAAAQSGDVAAKELLATRLAYRGVLAVERTWRLKLTEALIKYLEGKQK